MKRMTFIAHWVENSNWLFWWIGDLHRHPSHRKYFFWLWPICALMSVSYLFGKKAFDVVDRFVFRGASGVEVQGMTILTRTFGWHFVIPKQRDRIRQKILDAVLYAQEHNDVIGLGALIKDERITQGGKWIVDQLGDRLHVPIVHGDTLTAMVVIQQVLGLIAKYRITSPIFLTGSTSKIGRAVALYLARQGIKVIMYTQDRDRFEKIRSEAGEQADNLLHADSLSRGRGCALWVTGKAIPASTELLRHVPKGTIVLNFAVPNPLNHHDLKDRSDIRNYEGGLLCYDPALTDLHFTMRLQPGLTYACHAGTFVHAAEAWTHHEVGPVDIDRLELTWQAAQALGFALPEI